MEIDENDPINQNFYLPWGVLIGITQARQDLKAAYPLAGDDQAKQHIDEAYKTLQILANALNLQHRNSVLGSTPTSPTAPEAPELVEEDVVSLADNGA